MDIAIILVIGGAVFSIAFWIVVRRIEASAARVWHLARQDRAHDTHRAETALIEAAAHKVGPMVAAIRNHEERLEAHLRAQLAHSDGRARAMERRAEGAGVALDAASQLVRALRALLGEQTSRAEPAPQEPDPQERATVEMPRAVASGVAPPGSAVRLAPEPAMVAAGLTRPCCRSAAPGEPPRKATLRGILPPPLRAPDADDPDSGDSGEWLHREEVTREVKRPATSLTATTLPSMAPVKVDVAKA